jgi:hypothetical protein
MTDVPEAPGTPWEDSAVGGPVRTGWSEGTLTRAKELATMCAWARAESSDPHSENIGRSIGRHLEAARQAAGAGQPRIGWWFRLRPQGSLLERALSNLDAAEAQLVDIASADYLLAQIPSVLEHVRNHLAPTDVRRQEFERLAQALGISDPAHPLPAGSEGPDLVTRQQAVTGERGRIATAMRAAGSAALREQLRVRSFRNVVIVAATVMTVLMIAVALTGLLRPTLIPLCFAPQQGDQTVVVCPTAQSEAFTTTAATPAVRGSGLPVRDIDDEVSTTVTHQDLLVVELIGLIAAAVAAAATIRGLRGSSERHGLLFTLAVLKLPTGAVTAFLGLLLMRGQFVPGLSALDTSAQILAWALVFGYAQQLFTRLLDQQGQTVLNGVRGGGQDKPTAAPAG